MQVGYGSLEDVVAAISIKDRCACSLRDKYRQMLTGSSASVSVSPAPNCPGAVVICSDLDFRHPSPTLKTALNPLTREALAARVVV